MSSKIPSCNYFAVDVTSIIKITIFNDRTKENNSHVVSYDDCHQPAFYQHTTVMMSDHCCHVVIPLLPCSYSTAVMLLVYSCHVVSLQLSRCQSLDVMLLVYICHVVSLQLTCCQSTAVMLLVYSCHAYRCQVDCTTETEMNTQIK